MCRRMHTLTHSPLASDPRWSHERRRLTRKRAATQRGAQDIAADVEPAGSSSRPSHRAALGLTRACARPLRSGRTTVARRAQMLRRGPPLNEFRTWRSYAFSEFICTGDRFQELILRVNHCAVTEPMLF